MSVAPEDVTFRSLCGQIVPSVANPVTKEFGIQVEFKETAFVPWCPTRVQEPVTGRGEKGAAVLL